MAYGEQHLRFNGHVTGLRTAECRTHGQTFRTRPRQSGLPHEAIPGRKRYRLVREIPLTVNKLHRSKSQEKMFSIHQHNRTWTPISHQRLPKLCLRVAQMGFPMLKGTANHVEKRWQTCGRQTMIRGKRNDENRMKWFNEPPDGWFGLNKKAWHRRRFSRTRWHALLHFVPATSIMRPPKGRSPCRHLRSSKRKRELSTRRMNAPTYIGNQWSAFICLQHRPTLRQL